MANDKKDLQGFSGNDPVSAVTGAVDPAALGKNAMSNFQGMLSTKPVAKYMSGARTIIKINGRIAAFAQSVSWNIKSESKELFGIDNYMPIELVPHKLTVSGSLSGLVIPGNGPVNQLIAPDILSFLFNKYITIEVRDSQTDSLLFYTGKAMIVDRQESIRSGQLANITLKFKAIAFRDEKLPEYPRGANDTRNALKAHSARSPIERLSNVIKKWKF